MRQACLDMVYEMAKNDERVFFVGSDLGAGTMDNFRNEMPDRFFMEGISEANLIGMAAGLVGYGAHSLVEFHLIDKPFWAFLGVSLGLVLAAQRMGRDPELMKRYRLEIKVRKARGSGVPVSDPDRVPPGA